MWSYVSGFFHSAYAFKIYAYYYIYIPQFVYGFSSLWTFGLFLTIAYYE